MIRKGQTVKIKPEWQDAGDDKFTWIAVNDEDGGRVQITPSNSELPFPPVHNVKVEWID